MYKFILSLLVVFVMISLPDSSQAAPFKTYVSEFKVVGAPNKEELKTTLQGLLTSRLNPKQAKLVDKPENAEIEMVGSYAVFGKVFSIDLLIKNSQSGSLTKVFEQGESQDDLIPAFGRLAGKIASELAELPAAAAKPAANASAPVVTAAPAVAVAPVAAVAAIADKIEQNSYVVKSDAPQRNTPGNWTSEPLQGVYKSIALGRTLPSGEREFFVAGEQSILYLRKGSELKQIAEISVPVPAKVIAIDAADLDRDGIPEIYVSIVDRKTVSSRVYKPTSTGLELIVGNQPWLFRASGLDLKNKTVFAQAMGSGGDYINGVAELSMTGNSFKTGLVLNLPKPGNIYNSASFRDASGADRLAIVDEDGYLIIYSIDGTELGKSSDKFGGSESYINFESIAQSRNKIDKYRRNFLEQRITALSDGTLILPKNSDSTMSIGNNRSYNKHSIFGLQWGGSVVMESWHTRVTSSYLADYIYDANTKEFVLLEVVQKAGLFSSGKTVISVNKMK
jgi:hypothetical protein